MTQDRGLQYERTDLAWSRTMLALVATAALIARLTYEASSRLLPVAVGLLAACALLLAMSSTQSIKLRARRDPTQKIFWTTSLAGMAAVAALAHMVFCM